MSRVTYLGHHYAKIMLMNFKMAEVIFGAKSVAYDRYDSGVFQANGDREDIMIRKGEGQISISCVSWRHSSRDFS